MQKTLRLEAVTFAGSVATYDAKSLLKMWFYDEYNFRRGTFEADLTGKCDLCRRVSELIQIAGAAGLRANPVPGNHHQRRLDEYKNIYVISQNTTGLGGLNCVLTPIVLTGVKWQKQVVPIDVL
ncbi:hypothetical protein [Escherichia coli]|uniref:hypothetical protein n=1 Tax=Escherichia coli TaxID=562 RepID=UPI003975176F